ncbi:hypothetical protein ACFVRU_23350, partial [Streptomyces sp. NPDC057927]
MKFILSLTVLMEGGSFLQINLLNGINALKTKDSATEIHLEILDDELSIVDLSQYAEIVVNVGKNGTIYKTPEPTIYNDNHALKFTVDGNLSDGEYIIEINLMLLDGIMHIAPSRGSLKLKVEKSLTELGEQVTLLSVKQLLEDMDEVKRLAEITNANSYEALAKSNKALTKSTNAEILATEANAISKDVNDRTTEMELQVDDVISKTRNRVLVLCFPYLNAGINNLYGRFPFDGTIESVRGICSKFGADVITEIDIEKSQDMIEWSSIFDNSFLTFNLDENFDSAEHTVLI